jgi:hypothetical protein
MNITGNDILKFTDWKKRQHSGRVMFDRRLRMAIIDCNGSDNDYVFACRYPHFRSWKKETERPGPGREKQLVEDARLSY